MCDRSELPRTRWCSGRLGVARDRAGFLLDACPARFPGNPAATDLVPFPARTPSACIERTDRVRPEPDR